jgi:hypothetical protein
MLDEREQAIRERAYAIWEQDGRPEDRSLVHWSQAEAEIDSKPAIAVTKKSKPAKARRAPGIPKPVGESRSVH